MDISSSTIDSEDMLDISFESIGSEDQILASFEVFMTNSYIKHDDLYIPNKIYEHLPPKVHTALLDFRGKTWVATLAVGAQRRLRDGWKSFVQNNNIKATCILKISLVGTTSSFASFKIEVKGEGTTDNSIEKD